jgi:radical SAM protein
MTKACGLACAHCRADAQPSPGPDDLSTSAAFSLIDELAAIGSPRPILILTGGDCLIREDIVPIVEYARTMTVPVAIAPSVTPRLTSETLAALRAAGVRTASLSLDGSVGETHEGVRGIAGHFDATLRAIDLLLEHDFAVQINTTVMQRNVEELADVAALMHARGVNFWEVFFLISTGRGTAIQALDAAQNEDVCHFLVDASRYGFTVRTVEAPFFRRVAAQRAQTGDVPPEDAFGLGPLYVRLRDRLLELLGPPTARVRAPSAATRDGKGIVFVASNGDIYPSGFLPLVLGNISVSGVIDTYREDPTLRSIRAADFSGACGACEFADLCGGSRSRAFAESGDPLGEDPGCVLAKVAASRH